LLTIMSVTSSTYQAAWAGLEVRHLLALVAVVETGTFSAAAEQLGYTQSAVSQQVATLERIVGTPLFERPGGPRPVRLTAAGEVLLTHARAVLARVNSAATDLRALASGEQGELRVGTLPSVGTKILPRLLGTFRAEWPGIQIGLRESRDSGELIHAVETGDIDVTFIDIGPYQTGPLEVRPLLDDPMMFLAPAAAPEAEQRAVSIADIAHLPMIGTRNPGCRQIIDDAFRQAPVSPTYVFRSDDNPTIQGLIGSGLAYAVLPLLTVDEDDPHVAVIPIRPAPTPRRLGIAWHPERRPPLALSPFVEVTTEICRDLGEQWAASRAA
jgi:DNA-binding transcriptional LysR family regulator